MPSQKLELQTFSFNEVIWKILPASENLLIVETRDPEMRLAAFYGLNLPVLSLRWSQHQIEGSWWKGLAATNFKATVLQGMEGQDSPLSKGVWVIRNEDGRLNWSTTDWIFDHLTEENLVVKKSREEHQLLVLDQEHGNTS